MRRQHAMEKPQDWNNRITTLEREIARLAEATQSLRQDWDRARARTESLRDDYESMKEAILRYAIACGAVDVQVAMLRARGGEGHADALENLRRSMDEQTEASNALRALARTVQSGVEPQVNGGK